MASKIKVLNIGYGLGGYGGTERNLLSTPNTLTAAVLTSVSMDLGSGLVTT